MSFERTLVRNAIKKKVGKNKKVAGEWHKFRVSQFGLIPYVREFNATTKSHLSPHDIW